MVRPVGPGSSMTVHFSATIVENKFIGLIVLIISYCYVYFAEDD